jgi:hypothetical protein
MHYLEFGHSFRVVIWLYEAEPVCYQHDGVREHVLFTGVILCDL